MNDSRVDPLLHKHFSIEALESAPAPLEKAIRLLRNWMAAERTNPYPTTPFSKLIDKFDDYSIPTQGMEVDEFLDQLEITVLNNTAQLNHPMFIGHMTQALPWISVIAEAFTAALNQNQVKVETAYVSTLIEKQILGWLHRNVYCRNDDYYAKAMKSANDAIGNIVNGGTMGNLTALAVALERQFPGTRQAGLYASLKSSPYEGLVVVASARVHYSLKKAMATLGLGENALRLIPVDSDNRMDLHALAVTLESLKRQNIKVLALIGIAGTTETGAIDPLPELAAIARREQAWFHVDAAWGGALLLADRYKNLYTGIEQADSVVIDGHKLFWVPMAQSMVLFRDNTSLNTLKHNANYIIRDNSGDLGQTSLEGSRRFDALKLWTAFKVLGLRGYDALLEHASKLSDEMRRLIQDHPDFELITHSDTFILTYRYAPQHMQQQMAAFLADGMESESIALNEELNVLNAKLQEQQKTQGKSFVSRTVLESTPYPGDTTVLRVVLSNLTTTAQHLQAVLAHQVEIGSAILALATSHDRVRAA